MTSAVRPNLFLAVLCLGAAIAGCGGNGVEQQPPAAAVPVTNPVDPATAGTITGAVKLMGTTTPAVPINMSSDPYCIQQGGGKTQTVVVGGGGGLQHVFVYVKDGLGHLKFPVPQAVVVLDQRQCAYQPRVMGIQVGQSLEIVNSDDTLHNVHAVPATNREFNRGQAAKGMKFTHVFSTAEVMVPFKCDVHRWMNAWFGVLDHPFHAVSDANGGFELEGLPPGTYTIEAWHEKLGTRMQTVTLGAKESKAITFEFTI